MSSRKAIASRAKDFERVVAATWDSRRTPLSGINSGHGPGDVINPEGIEALLECKTRINSGHYKLWKGAVADAKKNKYDPKKTVLYFKLVGSIGHIVTVDGDLFSQALQIPEFRRLFEKGVPIQGKTDEKEQDGSVNVTRIGVSTKRHRSAKDQHQNI